MRKTILSIAVIALSVVVIIIFTGCSKNESRDNQKLKVMVSILPQVDFVERIGGDKVEVTAMIPPGFSPATYNPSPDQIKKLSEADLYVRIGHIPFEEAQMSELERMNPEMAVVDSSEGIALIPIAKYSHEHEEENGYEHKNEQGGDDPHIWLSPELVKIQAENIYNGLAELAPEDQDYFKQNLDSFLGELDNLNAELQGAFAPMAGGTVFVFHPAFGYLADAYSFTQEAIEIEGNDPTAGQLQEIINKAKGEDIKVLFVQKQFSTESAEVVAEEIGGAVVHIDPLAEDYFSNMRNIAETITEKAGN